MGGPMSVHDERAYPWLRQEKRFIESAIGAGKVVLGICLGAQLIAETLGAKVYANRLQEIGWFPVRRTTQAAATRLGAVLPEQFEAFHWHGETFELPAGAIHLARSEACAHQAFIYRERVLALQFHLETTRAGVEQLSQHCASDIVAGPFVQPAATMLADAGRFAGINQLMSRLLDRLAEWSA
jgi:GMP synthase-like glutamine amidotransferase